jgi:hypothetical protein
MNPWTLRWVAAASSAAVFLLSLPALASPPELAPAAEPVPTEVAPPVLPAEPVPVAATPAPADPAGPSGEALRIVEGPALAPAPAPEAAIVVPTPVVEAPPVVCDTAARTIGKRPSVGTGLMVGGAAGLALASVMAVIATVGRNEAGLTSKQTIPIGLTAVPVAGLGVAAMIAGIKANQKYTRWESDNGLDAPASGNGMLVAGVVLSSVGAVSMGFAIDHNRGVANPDTGDRAMTGVSAATLAAGVMLLGGGVIQRSRFSAWEGIGYVRPGFYAGREGGGLAISGRF